MGEYLPMREAARRVGISEPTFRRRVQKGLLPVYRDPCDWRRKLVREDEVDALFAVRPVEPTNHQSDE